MKNPWTKKNPFLSMWLSGANSVLGSARGHATAQAKRQTATMMTEGMKQMTNFWTLPLTAAQPKPRRRKKSR